MVYLSCIVVMAIYYLRYIFRRTKKSFKKSHQKMKGLYRKLFIKKIQVTNNNKIEFYNFFIIFSAHRASAPDGPRI